MNTTPAVLAGRCANGYERGRGQVVHVLPWDGKDVAYYARSLCGKTHGARSAGWSTRPGLQVTCEKCAKRAPQTTPEKQSNAAQNAD